MIVIEIEPGFFAHVMSVTLPESKIPLSAEVVLFADLLK